MNSRSGATAAMPCPAEPPRRYHPGVGDTFDPNLIHQDNQARRTLGLAPIYTPAIVGSQREIDGVRITDGPKRAYEYLVGRAGRNGVCWPSQDRMASDLGKSPRQIRNDLKVLETVGLISHTNRAGRKSNTYSFVWHDIFERQWAATQVAGKIRSIARFDRQYPANLSGSRLPTNLSKEFPQENSKASQSAAGIPSNLPAAPADSFDQSAGVPPGSVDSRPFELVKVALSSNNARFANAALTTMLTLAKEHGAEAEDLALFVNQKCQEKTAKGSSIRSAKFFFSCIPADLPAFLQAKQLKQPEPLPPRALWVDPYESLARRGDSHA